MEKKLDDKMINTLPMIECVKERNQSMHSKKEFQWNYKECETINSKNLNLFRQRANVETCKCLKL